MPFIKYKDITNSKFDEKNYLKTGIQKLDRSICGLGLGQLIIVTGTRGGGKSTLMSQMTLNFINNGYSGLLCSFEMQNSRLKNWLNLNALGKDNLRKEITETGKEIYFAKNEEQKNAVIDWINDKLAIYDNSSFDIKAVANDILNCLKENPEIRFIILDNLMKLEAPTVDGNKWEMQSKLVRWLQVFAQKHNICLILVVHPNKIKVLPRIEDTGGSGDIINSADTVLLVHKITDDFKIRAKEYFDIDDDNEMFRYNNIIEIAKDREFGMESVMCGTYFEPCAKRFLNYQGENIKYKWEHAPQQLSAFLEQNFTAVGCTEMPF